MAHEKNIINIGSHSIEVWHNKDTDDDFVYSAEFDGSNNDRTNESRFYLTYLNGVGCNDIPDSICLFIYCIKREFRRVNHVKIQKKNGLCEFDIILSINYQDWEMAESVGSFVYRFVDSIKSELKIEAGPEKTESGYIIECKFKNPTIPDLFAWYSNSEHSLEKIYQRELTNPPGRYTPTKTYGEGRMHWWIRYVLVPLIGSGTIAAVIAKYLLR